MHENHLDWPASIEYTDEDASITIRFIIEYDELIIQNTANELHTMTKSETWLTTDNVKTLQRFLNENFGEVTDDE